MSRIKSTVSTLLAFALVVTFVQAASAEEAWFAPPHNLSLSQPGGDATNPRVTVDSRGLATAVWQRSNGSNIIIQSSTSLNGATWSTPVNISEPGQNADNPQVTVDSDKRVIAVWQRSNGSNTVIQSSTSQNGATWSSPVTLSSTTMDSSRAQVAVDADGLATAVWQTEIGVDNAIIQSSTSLQGATWSTPVSLSAFGVPGSNSTQVTVASNGRAIAVWIIRVNNNLVIQSSTSLNGGSWSSPVTLSSTTTDSFSAQVAVDVDGLATAVWTTTIGGDRIIQSSTSLNGATWSTPVNLSETGRNAGNPKVAVDADGHVTAIWQRSNGSHTIIQSSTSLNGAAWSTPVNLSAAGQNANDNDVIVDSDGHATAFWQRSNGSHTIVQSTTSLNGATWSTPVNISEPGRDAAIIRVAVDSNNRLIAVWRRSDGVSNIIQSSNRSVPMPIGVVSNSSPAPQKQHVSTLDQTPAPGETVSMFGSFFDRVTEVFVGGVKVEIVSKSDNRVNIRVPRGLTGALDVELKSPLGSLLLPKHFTIGRLPAAGGQQTTLIVGGFDHNSRKLTARMQARIDRWLERNSNLSTLTCTGFTSLPRRTTDVQLSTNRGTTACSFAKSQRPDLTTSVSQGVEDPRPGSNVRRVKLVLTP